VLEKTYSANHLALGKEPDSSNEPTRFLHIVVTPRFRGQTRARIKYVLGSSLTHMITHGTKTNVTSLIYNGVMYKLVK
jgi:hypothetical protein